jgi:hypothetical protein
VSVFLMRKVCLVCALFTAIPVLAETPDDAAQARALDAIRQYALNYILSLPDFTCTQVTTRTYWPNQRRRENPNLDAIEEQLTFVDRKETYAVLRINGKRPDSTDHNQLGGISSSGEFGNLLSRTLDPKSNADFHWERTANVNGHRTWVFKFRVPQPRGYGLVESKRTIVVPYDGHLYADPETGVVYRIEMQCDIPKDSEYRQLELTRDLKPTDVSGHEFVLPSHFHLHTRKQRGDAAVIGETVSEADYKQYRRFAADASVHYESDAGPGR